MTPRGIRFGLAPAVLYFVCFCILTFPLIGKFSTHFFTDMGDGLQNVWNVWWVNQAVTELHQNPWHTDYLHFPTGTTLIGHTLNPFNGFLGIVLLKFLSLTQTFNFILVFTFVVGGMTAFSLAFYLTRSYWGSLIAGAVFTFSNYHFTHAEGHLQLVSLEWIPLFILCWLVFVKKPTILKGLTSASVLFLVLLCDYYYFLYCVMAGILVYVWGAAVKKDAFFLLRKKSTVPLLSFLGGVAATSGPIAAALLKFNRENVVLGVHHAKVYSLDLLAPLIPGGHWGLGRLTRPYWEKLSCGIHESSVHMGIPVIIALVFVWIHRSKIQARSLKLWYGILLLFLVLSLGPVMHIWGKELSWFVLPYALLEAIFPPLKLSGVPVRMMVMVMLSASVITAFAVEVFIHKTKGKKWILIGLLALLCVEYYPRPIPASQVKVPAYVDFLKELSSDDAVMDTVAEGSLALYYQTVHAKPMWSGYIARISQKVTQRTQRIRQLAEQHQFSLLYRSYHFRYYVSDSDLIVTSAETPIRVVFDDGNVRVYDLSTSN